MCVCVCEYVPGNKEQSSEDSFVYVSVLCMCVCVFVYERHPVPKESLRGELITTAGSEMQRSSELGVHQRSRFHILYFVFRSHLYLVIQALGSRDHAGRSSRISPVACHRRRGARGRLLVCAFLLRTRLTEVASLLVCALLLRTRLTEVALLERQALRRRWAVVA